MSLPIETLIVDDEVLARRRLLRLLEGRSEVRVVGEARSGKEATAAIRRLRPRLVFLDVQMPELDGIGALEELGPDAVEAVIFVTAYDRYALQAFDCHAVDYLLKPFHDDRFHQALDRALGRLRRQAADELSGALASALDQYRELTGPRELALATPEQPPGAVLRSNAPFQATDRGVLERLTLRSAGRIRFLEVEEIRWLQADGSYVRVHTGDGSHLLRQTLSSLADRLPGDRFVRIHRSAIVRIDQVAELRPVTHRDAVVLLKDGTELRMSRSYRDSAGPRLGLSP